MGENGPAAADRVAASPFLLSILEGCVVLYERPPLRPTPRLDETSPDY